MFFFQEKIILNCKFEFFKSYLKNSSIFWYDKIEKEEKIGPTMVVVPNSEDALLYPSVNWSLNIYSLQEKSNMNNATQDVLHGPHTQPPPTKKYNPFMHIIRFDKHERQVWKYDMGCVILPWVKKWLFHQQKFFERSY